MKKAFFFILAALFLFINCLPSSIVLADDSGYTDSQLADVGSLMLTSLISSGEATELDFSDYTANEGLDFLIALGELAVTGDPSSLVDQGLSWLGGELDESYQNLIEDIRAWEHDIAPDLYDWWYNGSQYEYKLVPNSNISRPLSKVLKSPLPTPQPSPDFSFINNINKVYADVNLITNGNNTKWLLAGDESSNITFTCSNVTYYSDNTIYHSSEIYPYDRLMIYNGILTIYFDTTTNTCRYVGNGWLDSVMSGHNGYCFYNVRYIPNSTYFRVLAVNDVGIPNPVYVNFQNSFAGLSTALNYFYQHFGNINLYIDNQPWAIAGYSNNQPIVIDGLLTVLNNQPAQYTFPDTTYIDLTGLQTLITNAINSSDVLTWQDIDDYFVDVNGIQALPVVQIYRNDYDNMYIEQYPYPAKLIGMQDPLTFNEHMLDNYYGQYLTPMVNVVENTVDVIPGEIKWVLGIGAILMIFAVIINRLLE